LELISFIDENLSIFLGLIMAFLRCSIKFLIDLLLLVLNILLLMYGLLVRGLAREFAWLWDLKIFLLVKIFCNPNLMLALSREVQGSSLICFVIFSKKRLEGDA